MWHKKWLALCVVGALTACGDVTTTEDLDPVETDPDRVSWAEGKADVYGEDERIEVRDAPSWARELARSTAILHLNKHIARIDDGDIILRAATMAQTQSRQGINLCRDERFREQPAAGFCSSFLVGPDLIATAGHCVQANTCDELRFAFDFQYNTSGTSPTRIERKDAYRCKDVIAYRYYGDRVAKGQKSSGVDIWQDWALIRLDRPVTGRTPLSFGGDVSKDQDVYMIGNPLGLPTKVSRGKVRYPLSNRSFFVTDMDGYSGNSGSAVFDRGGKITGVFTRGTGANSFVRSPQGCMTSRVCDEVNLTSCAGNHVTRTADVARLLKASRTPEVFSTTTARPVPGNGTPLTFTFDVDEPGDVVYATVQAKMTVGSGSDLRITLQKHGEGEPVTMVRTVKRWHLFWGETSFAFEGVSARGTWTMRVEDTNTSNSSSLQKMLEGKVFLGLRGQSSSPTPAEPTEPVEPNDGWIGGMCGADSDCDFTDGQCAQDVDAGRCVLACDRLCPDRSGANAFTFCIADAFGDGGECVSQCNTTLYPGTGCREGFVCERRGRFMEPGVTRSVCVPE